MENVNELIHDKVRHQTYTKGKLLGRGGFAKCFELRDIKNEIFAGKIILKSGIKTPSNQEKLKQEITIHKGLSHANIVKFFHFFEDTTNVYIVLELCKCKSLLELHKRRKTITEPETRYFSRQIAKACEYIHSLKVIHRDLKLANIFLNEDMIVKLGDFGLATKLDFDGERKKTMCGTPNYIAPEVLRKEGHSYEVDSWSLGCIIYTLLVGKPPFETDTLRDTYSRIKKNEYNIPFNLNDATQEVIRCLLHSNANRRPTMTKLLEMSFYRGYTPEGLPTSVMTTVPRFDNIVLKPTNRPLANITDNANVPIISGFGVTGTGHNELSGPIGDENHTNRYIIDLHRQLKAILANAKLINSAQYPARTKMLDLMEESEDPNLAPVYWVAKWVDYSDRYGLGYQLSDGSNGVVFNDVSRIILTANGQNLQFIEKDGTENLHIISNYPENLVKKVTLLQYFQAYMIENLMTAGENRVNEREGMVRLPYVKTWFRTKCAIVLFLSNGILQINLFGDHTKLILCPLMGAVTYIDGAKDFRTFKLDALRVNGMTHELQQRLQYTLRMIERILNCNSIAGKLDVAAD